jgi:VRR-NUC domain
VSTVLADLTEKEWQAQVKELATMLGYKRAYHTFDSRRSQSGFPDLVLVRDRVIFAELKRQDGKPSAAQKEWLDGLASAGAEVYLWRPSDLDEVATVLGKRWTFEKGLDDRRLLRTELVSYAPQSLWVAGVGRVDGQ